MVLPLSCAAAETFKIRAEPFYGDSRGNFPRGSLRLRHRAFPAGAESFGFLRNGFGNRVFSLPFLAKAKYACSAELLSFSAELPSFKFEGGARGSRWNRKISRRATKRGFTTKARLQARPKNDFANGKFPPEIILIPTKFIFFQAALQRSLRTRPQQKSGGYFLKCSRAAQRGTAYRAELSRQAANGTDIAECRSSEFKVDNSSDFAEN